MLGNNFFKKERKIDSDVVGRALLDDITTAAAADGEKEKHRRRRLTVFFRKRECFFRPSLPFT